MTMLRSYPGYASLHTRDEATGARRNGTRLQKIKSEPGDAHQNGSTATILGSLYQPSVGFGYFVEFDDAPRIAVFVMGFRCEPITEPPAPREEPPK